MDTVCFSGDTVFAGSVGRTDLPGGDHDTLLRSIRNKILCLDDDIALLPGHGPETSVGQEKELNPFLRDIP
jgi:glyoxylase-like metal-dependent hydrolase (beta-lactamase superfamily II)